MKHYSSNHSECSTIRFYYFIHLRIWWYIIASECLTIKRHDFGRLFRPVKFSVLNSIFKFNIILNLNYWFILYVYQPVLTHSPHYGIGTRTGQGKNTYWIINLDYCVVTRSLKPSDYQAHFIVAFRE